MSQRPIYIITYTSPLFPAHWALWIPCYNTETKEVGDVGKVVHVVGDAKNGFNHQFKRNYNVLETGRANLVHIIGPTNATNIADGPNFGDIVRDTIATDIIEEWALKIAAPGPSLRSGGSSSSVSSSCCGSFENSFNGYPHGPRTRVQIQNCQTWLRELVTKLVEVNILTSDSLEKLDNVPKN